MLICPATFLIHLPSYFNNPNRVAALALIAENLAVEIIAGRMFAQNAEALAVLSDDEIILRLRRLKEQVEPFIQNRMAFGGCCLVNMDDGSGSIAVRNCPDVGTCTTCGTIFGGSGHPIGGACVANRVFDWHTLQRVR